MNAEQQPVRTLELKASRRHRKVSTVDYWPEQSGLPIGEYVRLSKPKKKGAADRDLNQLFFERKSVRAKVGQDGAYVARTYTDPNHSGFKAEQDQFGKGLIRPAWNQLIEDLDARVIRGVACADIDRLTRQSGVLEKLCRRYEADPSLYWYCNDPRLDLRTPEGRNLARQKVIAYNEEVRSAQLRQLQRQEQYREEGIRVGRRGFGFTNEGCPLEAEAEVLRHCATLVEAGIPMKGYLEACQVTTANGKPLSVFSIKRVLRSPRMVGYRTEGRLNPETGEPLAADGIYRDGNGNPVIAHAGILELDQWLRVRDILEGGPRAGRPDLTTARQYLLTSIFRCQGCGYAMGGGWLKERNTYRYCCPGGHGRCGRNNINGPRADEYIKGLVEARLAEAPAAEAVDPPPFPKAGDIADLEAQGAQDLAAMNAGTLAPEVWAGLERARVIALGALRQEETQWHQDHPRPAGPTDATLLDHWRSGDLNRLRLVVGALFDHVMVKPGGGWSVDRLTVVPNRNA